MHPTQSARGWVHLEELQPNVKNPPELRVAQRSLILRLLRVWWQ